MSDFTLENGYISKTTFYSDFRIADAFGMDAVKDTYERAFAEWKDNVEYLTELVIVLNMKCWEHYHKENFKLSELYSDLYYKARDYALNLKDDDFQYFWKWTD